MLKYNFIDASKIIVIGISNGGGTAPLVPRQHPVRRYIAASSWGRTWYEHMLEMERVRLTKAGKSPAAVNSAIKVFAQVYNLYLINGLTPGEILTRHPDWKPFWYDAPDGQYGRPAAFYQQLQALNLGEAWQNITVPVLVRRGTADNIMSDGDARAPAENVNRAHPGSARYEEIKDADHLFTINGKFADEVVPTMLSWMREHLAK